MWQRIQTVYLLIAIIVVLACQFLTLGCIIPEAMEANITVTNWNVAGKDNIDDYTFCLGTFLNVANVYCCVAIFQYKRRKRQAWSCLVCAMSMMIWYATFAALYFIEYQALGDFRPSFALCLPFVAFILHTLARKAILKDEALVRAADRIR